MSKEVKAIFITLAFGFLFHTASFSQPRVKILDKETGSPVPYATVKMVNAPGGVIANEHGEFSLPEGEPDSILISSVGYEPVVLAAAQTGTVIYLKSKVRSLHEVVLREPTFLRTIMIGDKNRKVNDDYNWGLLATKDEFAQKIDLPDTNLVYRVRRVFIPVKKHGKWGPLLLHIYAFDTGSIYPGEELLVRSIFIKKEVVKNDQVMIDLSDQALYIRNSPCFFIGVSYHPEVPGNTGFTTVLLLKSPGYKSFSRTMIHSNYNWFPFSYDEKGNQLASTFFSVELDEGK